MPNLRWGRSVRERICRSVGAIVVLALIAAACGTPAPIEEGSSGASSDGTAISSGTTSSAPSSDGTVLSTGTTEPGAITPVVATAFDELAVSCAGIDLGSYPFDPARLERYEGVVEDLVGEEARVEWDPLFAAVEEWFVGERTASGLALITPAESGDGSEFGYGYAIFEQQSDGLRLASWGSPCVVEAALDGYGAAELALPIGEVAVPGSRVFSLLATERACASGRPPEGREVLVLVDETTEQVDVVVLVESPDGAQLCPGNPSFTVRIELDSPLGDRPLFDAGPYPGIRLRGPDGVLVTDTTLSDTFGIDTTDTSAPGREGYGQAVDAFVACIRANGIQTGQRYVSESEISLDATDVPDPNNPSERLSAAQVQDLVEATSCFDDYLAGYNGATVVYLDNE